MFLFSTCCCRATLKSSFAKLVLLRRSMGDSKSVSALRRSACGDMRISNMRYGYDASLEYPSVECFIQPIVSRQNSCCTSRATERCVWQSHERICNMLSLKHETLFPSQQMKQHLNQLQQQYSSQRMGVFYCTQYLSSHGIPTP